MNKVMLVGNLTRDPELRTTQNGTVVCNFTLAVNRRYANAQGVREADFIPIVCWRQLAELCHRYLLKGKKVCIWGSIQTRSYETPENGKRFVTEVLADEVEFIDRSPGAGVAPGDIPPPPPPEPPASPGTFSGDVGFTQIDDDELPF